MRGQIAAKEKEGFAYLGMYKLQRKSGLGQAATEPVRKLTGSCQCTALALSRISQGPFTFAFSFPALIAR